MKPSQTKTQVDEKGKIFTPVVTKQPLAVTIQTDLHLIRGNVYIKPDERLKDALTADDPYLAVTDARVFNKENEQVYHCNFMTLNQAHIIWLIPDEDLIEN